MGYTTYFSGEVEIDPPLNEHEVSFLKDLAATRRMARTKGPLYVGDDQDDIIAGNHANGQQALVLDRENNVYVYQEVPDDGIHEPGGQPSLWLHWEPNQEGTAISWNGEEKFYSSAEWMKYLVANLLAPTARSYIDKHKGEDPRLEHFTCDHVCNGEILADGEEPNDFWKLLVKDNTVAIS